MISELEPVWKQFSETYDALRHALTEVPDERLHWKPGPQATTVAEITQHLSRSNIGYSGMMVSGPDQRPAIEEAPSRERLLELLAGGLQQLRSFLTEFLAAAFPQFLLAFAGLLRGALDAGLDALLQQFLLAGNNLQGPLLQRCALLRNHALNALFQSRDYREFRVGGACLNAFSYLFDQP